MCVFRVVFFFYHHIIFLWSLYAWHKHAEFTVAVFPCPSACVSINVWSGISSLSLYLQLTHLQLHTSIWTRMSWASARLKRCSRLLCAAEIGFTWAGGGGPNCVSRFSDQINWRTRGKAEGPSGCTYRELNFKKRPKDRKIICSRFLSVSLGVWVGV